MRTHRIIQSAAVLAVAASLAACGPAPVYKGQSAGPPTTGATVGATAPTTASPTATGGVPVWWPHPPASPRVPADILNATITVPAASKLWAAECPSGVRAFVDGVSPFDHNSAALNIHADVRPIQNDLDGVDGDETIVDISCDTQGSLHVEQLVAIKPRTGGGWSTLGSVLPAAYFFDRDTVIVGHREVTVELMGPYQNDGGWTANKQSRTYRFDNGAFHQVGGPTTFPPLLKDMSTVDIRNAGIRLALNQFSCHDDCIAPLVQFHDGTAAQWVTMWQHSGTDYRIDSSGGMDLVFNITSTAAIRSLDGHLIDLIVVRWGGIGYGTAGLFAIDAVSGGIPAGPMIVQSGVDGVADVLGVAVSGGTVTLTVATAAGQQTRTYHEQAGTDDGYGRPKWARAS